MNDGSVRRTRLRSLTEAKQAAREARRLVVSARAYERSARARQRRAAEAAMALGKRLEALRNA